MNERLSYIDSLKGLAILFVLLLHSLSDGVRIAIWAPVHIGQAVPIFLAVTFFLSFLTMDKIGGSISEWFKLKRIKKMLRRVVLPFAVVLCIQCANLLYIGGFQPIIIVAGGGYGPGSYYLWVYLQVWILAPFLYRILKWKPFFGSILILIICIALNVVCSKYCPELLWRLLAVRYIFLSVAAWIWFRYQDISIRHKFVTLLLGITSLVYILFFANHDWSPLIYHGGWNSQNYPTFFWTLLFILILIRLISIIPQRLNKRLEWLGVNSWEIFLAQMFIIGFVRELLEIGGPVLTSALYVLFVLVTSIGSVVLYKLLLRRLSIV